MYLVFVYVVVSDRFCVDDWLGASSVDVVKCFNRIYPNIDVLAGNTHKMKSRCVRLGMEQFI